MLAYSIDKFKKFVLQKTSHCFFELNEIQTISGCSFWRKSENGFLLEFKKGYQPWSNIIGGKKGDFREGVGYVETQLSCILLYYADDGMFRPLWAIFRSQKCT